MLEGGLPPGVLNIVTGPGGVVGEEIIRNPLVRKIGFTGETGTGKQVAKSAADELPFGGTKHSGYGKEHGTEVLDYYTEQKSVVVAA